MTIHILGRQPALGLAELESLYGAGRITPVHPGAALLGVPKEYQFSPNRLGGTIKTAELLARVETTDWDKVIRYIAGSVPGIIGMLPEGKLKLGLSVIGFNMDVKSINAAGLSLKKTVKNHGRSIRVVPNTEHVLSSAQTLHNKLVSDLGMELVIIRYGDSSLLGRTDWVQDIDSYTLRDRGRPKRDARIGMLPPKLAQIMINLGTGGRKLETGTSGLRVLDPFCGTGVVLQESALMGFNVYGTDLNEQMVEFTKANLDWLEDKYNIEFERLLDKADATDVKWHKTFDTIVSETYLGRPFSALPGTGALNEVVQDVNTILTKFLQNAASQTEPGFRLCLAVPAWKTGEKFKRLPLVDRLSELGYNRVSFEHAANEDLIYHRPGQTVARELLVLTRK